MISRLRAVAAVAVLAAAVTTGVAVSNATAGSPEPVERRAPVNLRATLTDTVAPASGGLVTWTTRWELRWDPVPDARAYEIRAVGPEGEATRPIATVTEPAYGLSVAAGTTTEAARVRHRDAQAAYRATQLGVSVAAVYRAGTTGPRTAVVPVGSLPGEVPRR